MGSDWEELLHDVSKNKILKTTRNNKLVLDEDFFIVIADYLNFMQDKEVWKIIIVLTYFIRLVSLIV